MADAPLLTLPANGVNLIPNPGAETNTDGLTTWIEYIHPPNYDPNDPRPPEPDPASLTVSRDTVQHHSGTASFRIDKTMAIDPAYRAGTLVVMENLVVNQGYIIDYWIYLPTGSGANAGAGRVGIQPMPSVMDPFIDSPEEDADTDDRRVGITMRTDPPTAEGSWIRQQVTFYATRTKLNFRLTTTNLDVFTVPLAFHIDDIVVMHDSSLGTATPPPEIEPEPEPPLISFPPVPIVFCSLDPRSTVTPVVIVGGDNLFADARAYWWLDTHHPDGTLRAVPPETLATFESEYTTYNDITTGYTQVESVVRYDGHGTSENIQYKYPVPIQDGTFGIMDIDAPMDTWYQYTLTIRTNDPVNPLWVVTTNPCSINSSLFAPEYAGCSAALLSDPLVVSYAQWFGLTGIDPLSWPGRRDLFEVISAKYPIAQADIRMMARTNIRGVTKTLEERTKMLEILGSGRILRLRIPDPQYPEANWYLSVGNVSESRILTDHRRPERRWELEVAVVERPVGTINSWDYTRNYQDLHDFFGDGSTALSPQNYSTVLTEYVDYLAVLYGDTYSVENAGLPVGVAGYEYGDGRWPSIQAVTTSINWTPVT